MSRLECRRQLLFFSFFSVSVLLNIAVWIFRVPLDGVDLVDAVDAVVVLLGVLLEGVDYLNTYQPGYFYRSL